MSRAESEIAGVRSFNRAVTRRVGALETSFLGRGRPLAECRLLFEIGQDGARIADLRARLGLDSGYASRLLRALERQGLVVVAADRDDRRSRVATLTAAGKAEWRALDRLSDDFARGLLGALFCGLLGLSPPFFSAPPPPQLSNVNVPMCCIVNRECFVRFRATENARSARN